MTNKQLSKINLGCGTDYREGFVNVDGSSSIPKVDKIIDIGKESLFDHFNKNEAEFILAQDIIEHHYHWIGQGIMEECFEILAPNGELEIRVPDMKFIILNPLYSIEEKVRLIFGGQDIPNGNFAHMDESRKLYPQYFCHKYGWTRKSMRFHLERMGFRSVSFKRQKSNMVATALK
ncbi:MAG: class I SAM-dependent methyltransferase [Roseibacillus sp.]